MPSELNRRAFFAAAAAFLVALAVAYALGSTGQASEGSGAPGAPATPLNVASGAAAQTTFGEAQALPDLVARPKPPPAESEESDEEFFTEEPVDTTPEIPYTPTPTPVTPTPTPTPTPEPGVEFDDSG
jgi:outer membrane biosynthesis protein TonB